ncbi:MAG TPA: hypothetical protein VEO01_03965, partial [Pseudonocardiaceae bacterium]|nr:hypothetical protein [Pseudonocardiaceae bacterium]
ADDSVDVSPEQNESLRRWAQRVAALVRRYPYLRRFWTVHIATDADPATDAAGQPAGIRRAGAVEAALRQLLDAELDADPAAATTVRYELRDRLPEPQEAGSGTNAEASTGHQVTVWIDHVGDLPRDTEGSSPPTPPTDLERLAEEARERFANAGYTVAEPTEEVPPPQPAHTHIWFVDEAGVSREVLVRPNGTYMVFDADGDKFEKIPAIDFPERVAGRRHLFVVAWPASAEPVELNDTAPSRQPPPDDSRSRSLSGWVFSTLLRWRRRDA